MMVLLPAMLCWLKLTSLFDHEDDDDDDGGRVNKTTH